MAEVPVPESNEHDTPAKQEKRQKRSRYRDERGRRALSGQHPDHHASPGRAKPGAKTGWPDGQRPSPCPDRDQADAQPCQERPGGLPDPRHAVPVTVSVAANSHEHEHAAGIRRHSGCDLTSSSAHPATVSEGLTWPRTAWLGCIGARAQLVVPVRLQPPGRCAA
jgi:hypothetical protein